MPPLRDHSAFPLPSTILGPTTRLRPFGSMSSSRLHHLSPYPLPISTTNSTLDSQQKRHASQMLPFSQHGQGLAEANQRQHAQHLATATKAMRRVIHTCSEDDIPTHRAQVPIRIFVAFILPSSPNFPCSYSLVSPTLSLPFGIWGGVDIGYVVERHAGDPIFLRANYVADTPEFDKHTHSRTLYSIYDTHLCHNLPREGGYVHEKFKEMAWEQGQRERESDFGCEETPRILSLLNGHHPLYPQSTTSASPSTIENPPHCHRQSQQQFTDENGQK